MPATVLDPDQLTAYLPHRDCNLMLDEVRLDTEAGTSASTTVVPDDDPRGRTIFARRDAAGRRFWHEPFIAEVLALTGVCLLRDDLAEGQVAVFSAISRYRLLRPPPQDRALIADSTIRRRRGEFTQFNASISCDGEATAEMEVMSGIAAFADVTASPIVPPEGASGAAPQADFGWKDPAIRFLDGVRSCDPATGELVGTYVYPADHPFTVGHFPAAAIMMGVTQWAAVADAGYEAAQRCALGPRVQVDGGIRKSDGSEVVDVRELILDCSGDSPVVEATKRVAFRAPVRPGDGLVITVQVRSC